MAVESLKRNLWVMNRILQAGERGVTRKEINDDWQNSSMNDDKEKGKINDRMFYRIRNELQSAFDLDIKCVRGIEPRYYVEQQYLAPGKSDMLSLLEIGNRSDRNEENNGENERKHSDLFDILNLLVSGGKMDKEERNVVRQISRRVNEIPWVSANNLVEYFEKNGIKGADSIEGDPSYRCYINLWNDRIYNEVNGLWLSVGFYSDSVYFYVVTEEEDPEKRQEMAEALELTNGNLYKLGRWWYEPKDRSLFHYEFESIYPDVREVVKRAEILLEKIDNYRLI